MTDPAVVSYRSLDNDWTVDRLLDLIATASPPYHALIDTGALITGLTNVQVLLGHRGAEGPQQQTQAPRALPVLRILCGSCSQSSQQHGSPWVHALPLPYRAWGAFFTIAKAQVIHA